MESTIWRAIGIAALALSATFAYAQDVALKPFVLASRGAGDSAQTLEATKAALTKAGFTVAGSYSPYPGAAVIGVTNDELRPMPPSPNAAASARHAPWP